MDGPAHLRLWYSRAIVPDIEEGKLAYTRYHQVMLALSSRFGVPLPQVIAAFVSLSPNNDYFGNLKSTVSVLDGIKRGIPCADINISTYKHCRDRAFAYATGTENFHANTKGLKVMSFYQNVLDPTNPAWVTVDGHMVAIWRNENLTMKQAIIRKRKLYFEVRDAVRKLATELDMVPNMVQAVLWFTRKRVLHIKYAGTLDMFFDHTDHWKTMVDVSAIKPYPPLRG